jgi:hypothetical protein
MKAWIMWDESRFLCIFSDVHFLAESEPERESLSNMWGSELRAVGCRGQSACAHCLPCWEVAA